MKSETSVSNAKGATAEAYHANSGYAMKLASWLPGCGLEKLTDDEAAQLLGFFDYLADYAGAEGYQRGIDAMARYNDDVARLRSMPPTMTPH